MASRLEQFFAYRHNWGDELKASIFLDFASYIEANG
jgi:hypothetical protein